MEPLPPSAPASCQEAQAGHLSRLPEVSLNMRELGSLVGERGHEMSDKGSCCVPADRWEGAADRLGPSRRGLETTWEFKNIQ